MIGCVIYYKITESNVRLLNTPTVALYWIELGDIDDTKEEKKRFFFFLVTLFRVGFYYQ